MALILGLIILSGRRIQIREKIRRIKFFTAKRLPCIQLKFKFPKAYLKSSTNNIQERHLEN